MIQIEINSIDELQKAAKQFIALTQNKRVFAFFGGMGAGKTTFIKAICRELGVNDNITSPTFALINEYSDRNSEPIFHFDCYRLKSIEEAFDIGAEEYFYSGHYCFVEWPEKVETLMPESAVIVKITVNSENKRLVEIGE